MAELEGWQWSDYDVLTSTNDKAKEQSNLATKPLVISAICQTKGRGRRGRTWVSKEGNLFFSQLLSFPMPLSDLVFISSLSVAKAILEIAPQLAVKIKWPNDVLIDGKKVCGILLETGENATAIIGIGINLRQSPSADDILYPTTALGDLGVEISRDKFLKIYLQHFNYWTDIRLKQSFEPIRSAWLELAAFLDEKITVNCTAKNISGIFKGIDEQGLLLLKQEEKIIYIAAGDVFA